MPIKVVDEGRIRNWPDEYVGEFRNALIEDKEVKIDNIVNESTTSLDIEFDIEDFITEGLEEVEKLKEMKIFDILKEIGGEARVALALLTDKPKIAANYEDYTLGDVIDDDFKRNQLIGYSFFAYEKEGETEEGRGIYKPISILPDTLDMGRSRERNIKGIPDLDWQDISFTNESEKAIDEMEGFRTKLSTMKDVDPEYQKIVEEELKSIPTMLEVGDMEEIQKKHILKYYDSVEMVPVSEPPVKMTKKIDFDKDGSFKEKIARIVAGNLNPSILGEISITINNIVNDENSFSADLTIIQEQDARLEIRPFGGGFRRTVSGAMSDAEFKTYINKNKNTIQIDKDRTLEDILNLVELDTIFEYANADSEKREKIVLDSGVDNKLLDTIAGTINRIKEQIVGGAGKVPTKTLAGYRANIKMDDILQDIEERYVNLEDDIANAKDLIGVED
tara:strand:- start:1579 stop:2922 length:1344 start_codon:yes stop_codon:yes gene_type:complete